VLSFEPRYSLLLGMAWFYAALIAVFGGVSVPGRRGPRVGHARCPPLSRRPSPDAQATKSHAIHLQPARPSERNREP
jgi:hypothetical protein